MDTHLERGRDWARTCLVQFRMFSQQVVAAARLDEDGDHPMLGGENSDVISDEIVRTPITLSPDGSGEIASEMDGVDVPIPGTPPGEELFWETWLAEIAESEKEELRRKTEADDPSRQLLAQSQQLLAEDEWLGMQELSDGPDPSYHLEAYDYGLEYAYWLDGH